MGVVSARACNDRAAHIAKDATSVIRTNSGARVRIRFFPIGWSRILFPFFVFVSDEFRDAVSRTQLRVLAALL